MSNGNVGIGTTTPTALLDVNGDVVISGSLTAENLIVDSINLITEINTKQNIINDDDLQISKILNLQSSLDTIQNNIDLNSTNILNKQDLIDISITLEGFNISENINFLNSTNTDYEYLDYSFLNTLRLKNATFGTNLTANNIILTGNLKATLVQVSTTNPTLNTHLTSKLYVDTQDNLSAKLSSANDFIGNQKITGNLNVGGTFTLKWW